MSGRGEKLLLFVGATVDRSRHCVRLQVQCENGTLLELVNVPLSLDEARDFRRALDEAINRLGAPPPARWRRVR